MTYSCNYPVMHTFNTGGVNDFIDYNIIFNGKQRYRGRVHPFDTSEGTVQIDISEVCRNFLEPLYEQINFNWSGASSLVELPYTNDLTTIGEFIVSSESNPDGTDVSYKVMYNYNTDYISEYADTGILSDPVITEVDPRQRIFLTAYSNAQVEFDFKLNGNNADSKSIISDLFVNYGVNLAEYALQKGDRLELSEQTNLFSVVYTVVEPCRNRYALYYVNKIGGLDSMLFTARAVESYNASNVDVELYNNRLNRQDWEQKRIYREIDKVYTLNSGFIETDAASRKIDNLFNSVKVWIHDLEQDTITSVIIMDNSINVQEKRYDGLISYSLNVKESQKQIRR